MTPISLLIIISIIIIIIIICNCNVSNFDNESLIPKNIYICYKTIKGIPKFVPENWAKLNPEYNIHLFGDKECREFIQKYYPKMYVNCFNTIPYGPIKSDFWRLCIIYQLGGIYVDADIEPLVPIREFLLPNTHFFVAISGVIHKDHMLNPHIFGAVPKDKVVKRSLEIMIDKCQNKKLVKDYWGMSVTKIMYTALVEEIGLSNFDRPLIRKNNKTYQLLIDRCPDSPHNFYTCYTEYDGKKLMNNRFKKEIYNRNKFV